MKTGTPLARVLNKKPFKPSNFLIMSPHCYSFMRKVKFLTFSILLLSICLLVFSLNTVAQCESINGSTDWIQHNTGGTAANSYVYDDGTYIRLANTTTNARIANATQVQFNTIVKATAGADLNTEQSTISITYRTGNAAGDPTTIGWSANSAFSGGGVNARVTSTNPTPAELEANWVSVININGNNNIDVRTASGLMGALQGNLEASSVVVADGDIITGTLIPQLDGSAALNVKVYRPSSNSYIGNETFYNAVNINTVDAGEFYPVLQPEYGAVNLSCLSATTATNIPSATPATCESINGSTDWTQHNTGGTTANSYIYDDGTYIRLANATTNARIANATQVQFNTIVKATAGADLNTEQSTISITYRTGTALGDPTTMGWSANSAFSGGGVNARVTSANPTPAELEANWVTVININGNNNLDIRTASGLMGSMGANARVVVSDGDIITGTLIPQPDGSAALNVKVYRPSSNGYIAEKTFYSAVNANTVDAGDFYPALQPEYGAVNLSCLSASAAVALPVGFGTITGKLSNNQLLINWQTLTESNNDHFEIEASTDGKNFTKIGTLASQATDGNSSQPLNYEFSIEAAGASALMGIGSLILLAGSLMAKRRNRKVIGLSALSFMVFAATFVSCNKKGDALDVSGNKPLYIRIAQVDKDGKKAYSEVVKVFNQK
ncbi:hypothetical protein [Niabella ginsengisoli]|uniref:LPXTG cell wall anchor domain-containing protein n=1 Tax=Niabella ginsengisoli TaxID=522298 RepID=A0ABS9SP77_9BACT|nr:hypothetical protein [Niabella ginsengisoli]MCH5600140.1 hypothetical protein [Niabella ginsengisoli]